MPNSTIFLFLWLSNSLLLYSVYLSLLQFVIFIFRFHTYVKIFIQYFSFYVWLNLLNIVPFWSIDAVVNSKICPFRLSNIPFGASLIAQLVKNLPVVQEIWVWSLGWEDTLLKGMATHSSILPWRIPWIEEPGRLQSMGPQGSEKI